MSDTTPIEAMCKILKKNLIVADEYTDCVIVYKVTFDQLRNLYDQGRSAILADREKQAARVPEGYALVSIEQLTAWKNRVNTLATLSLKAERYEVGRELKTEIADVIAVPVPPGLAAPTTEPSKQAARVPGVEREATELLRELVLAQNDYNDCIGAWGNGRPGNKEELRLLKARGAAHVFITNLAAPTTEPSKAEQADAPSDTLRIACITLDGSTLYIPAKCITDFGIGDDDSETYTLTFKTMTRAEFDALGEFDGF